MRGLLMSIVTVASLAVGVVGCKHNSSTDPGGSNMNTAMSCCGDSCKKMGGECCKKDDKGVATCSMGGSCCMKTDKPAM